MQNNEQELLHLKKHMKMNNMLPAEEIIVDNKRYDYWITKDGVTTQASYFAISDPLDVEGPSLICSYGLHDEVKQFSYTSALQNNL